MDARMTCYNLRQMRPKWWLTTEHKDICPYCGIVVDLFRLSEHLLVCVRHNATEKAGLKQNHPVETIDK
jgi:hypothetical protein